jgi:hypothetical protein
MYFSSITVMALGTWRWLIATPLLDPAGKMICFPMDYLILMCRVKSFYAVVVFQNLWLLEQNCWCGKRRRWLRMNVEAIQEG